jgi:WD40 repeat protein
MDGTIRLFSIPEFDQISRIDLPDCWMAMFSRTGKYLASGQSGAAFFWRMTSGAGLPRSLEKPAVTIRWYNDRDPDSLDFSPGDQFVAVSVWCYGVLIVSLETGAALLKTFRCPEISSVIFAHTTATCLVAVPDSRPWFSISYSEGSLFDSDAMIEVDSSEVMIRAQFTCDDSRIVALTTNAILVVSPASRTIISRIPSGPHYHAGWLALPHPIVASVCVVMCQDGTASVWDVEKGVHLHALEHATGEFAHDGVWTLDGEHLIVSDGSGKIHVYGARGQEFGSLRVEAVSTKTFPAEDHLHQFFVGSSDVAEVAINSLKETEESESDEPPHRRIWAP